MTPTVPDDCRATAAPDRARGRVGLFVTCLVDAFRPSVAFAALSLIRFAGYRAVVPARQTCCGQPGYNAGDVETARALARKTIDEFRDVEWVVVPSGSCAGTIAVHYPTLLRDDAVYGPRARDLAARTYELTRFLHEVACIKALPPMPPAPRPGALTYHDSCSCLRELGIAAAPRALLALRDDFALAEMEADQRQECCGFGGSFAVKFPNISARMAGDKAAAVAATGAATLVGADLGCLLNIAGKLSRDGHAVSVRHVAEILAGEALAPAIGEPE